MDLYVLRHGKAEGTANGRRDADRALTGKGRAEIKALAGWLADQEISFDVIASSPLTRAKETADIIAKMLGLESRMALWESLGPGGDPATVLRDADTSREDSSVLIVGHEPALSLLVSRIIAGSDDAAVVMAKGSLAKIRNYSFAARPSGELQWLVTPGLVTVGQ